MTDQKDMHLDPNVAALEKLTELPGVGPALAERIIAARPFDNAGDLRRVSGIGESALQRLTPYLVFDSALPGATEEAGEEEEAVEVAVEAEAEEAEPEPAEPAPVRPPAERPTTFTRSEVMWLTLGTGLISLVLSVVLALAILVSINGTLDLTQNQAFRQLQTDLRAVSGNLDDAASQVSGIRSRLDALEGLSGRMTGVENEVLTLQGEIDQALEGVGTMQTSLDALAEETQTLGQRINRFDSFLGGLRELLSEILPEPSS